MFTVSENIFLIMIAFTVVALSYATPVMFYDNSMKVT